MREIKFKFLMENGEVTKPYYLRELIDSDSYINIECEYSSKIKQELQYTGLKDKNDVEIYEGDIIRVNKLTYDKNNEFNTFIGIVEFYKGCFHMSIQKMLLLSYGEDVEIIGNIYENPELLEQIWKQ